jgi:hypothetical protein
MKIIMRHELPEDCELCPDILNKYREFAEIQYMGKNYYIPIPDGKLLKFLDSNFNMDMKLEDYFRQIIAALYLQVRDTVGSEVYRQTSDDLKSFLETMFSENLSKTITNKLNEKLLIDPPGSSV